MSREGPARGEIIARRARVRGRVQGVWFRATTAERATEFGVRGHARNLADGSVEVLAIGPAGAVEELVAWLWEGPSMARVDEVTVEALDTESVGPVSGFATR